MNKKSLIAGGLLILVLLGMGATIWMLDVTKEVPPVAATPAVLSNEPDLDWQQNGKNNEYITYLLEGNLRVKTAAGTVLSDANCEADEQGISRCHNEIALSDTQKITVVNVHNMNNYACLAPGDTVNIEPYSEGWLKVTKTGDGQ